MATQEEGTVTFGDKTVELSTFERYKGRKGQKDCITIIAGSLLRAHQHWHNQKGFRCLSTLENRAECCKQLGEPEQKFGIVLFQYTVDQEGNYVDPTKCQGKVRLWVISETRYEELTNLHRRWPLLDGGFGTKQHDILVNCTEEGYQKMTFTPTPEAHWKTKQNWYDALKAKEIKAREKLKLALGRSLTELEVMELLGTSESKSQTGSTNNAGDIDLSDVIDDVKV